MISPHGLMSVNGHSQECYHVHSSYVRDGSTYGIEMLFSYKSSICYFKKYNVTMCLLHVEMS